MDRDEDQDEQAQKPRVERTWIWGQLLEDRAVLIAQLLGITGAQAKLSPHGP